jgi:putative ubiquitin-RnfH superfamily antitoxin RatB of RatAB toxin-antitoxin module
MNPKAFIFVDFYESANSANGDDSMLNTLGIYWRQKSLVWLLEYDNRVEAVVGLELEDKYLRRKVTVLKKRV